jgi:uncharacterized protein GlcG (DUF336 family)
MNVDAATATAASAVSFTLQRKVIDQAQSQAASLLSTMTPTSSLNPSVGGSLDVRL